MTLLVVVDDQHEEESDQFLAVVDAVIDASSSAEKIIAFDCEGVNLSRVGTVELVTVCFGCIGSGQLNDRVFLVDVNRNGDPLKLPTRIATLKKLFECETVQKVIHDARMDCDALFHLHHIRVTNVHDTSCCHAVATGWADQPLNTVLAHHGIRENNARDSSVYQRNPRFWETRPLTKTMMDWASSDVDQLLTVAVRQTATLKTHGLYDTALLKSRENAVSVSDAQLQRGLVCRINVGRLIGPNGSNIRRLQQRTNTTIYQDRETQTWMVYYKSQASLDAVKRAMGIP